MSPLRSPARLLLLALASPALLLLGAEARADSLTTTFAGGNSHNGNMFTVRVSREVAVDSLVVHIGGTCTTGWEIYATTDALSAGTAADPGAWTLVGAGSGDFAAEDQPTLHLDGPLSMAAGETWALYVTLTEPGCSLAYTNGTAVGAAYAANADLELLEGYGVAYPFSSVFSPRVWNGTVNYIRCPGVGAFAGYADVDGDSYGDPSAPMSACVGAAHVVVDDTDCDDADVGVHPAALEFCDGKDNNCDGDVDESAALDAVVYYADGDGDAYGTTGAPSCARPPSSALVGGDCDDTNSAVNPSVAEVCDGVDDDCDSFVDEHGAVGERLWFHDGDGDGFGSTGFVLACDAPPSYLTDHTDCDDARAGVHPGAPEVCNLLDDDCDGIVDGPAAIDRTAYFVDGDLDGFGGAVTVLSCIGGPGRAVAGGDCDDGRSAVHPGALERCLTAYDDDCDGVTNEASAVDAGLYFGDADSDGYGDPARSAQSCVLPLGFVTDGTDCDDALSDVNPGEPERCFTPFDDDCDGAVNEASAVDARLYYEDVDSDGYGDPVHTLQSCAAPTGFISDNTDCDDALADVNPGEPERCFTPFDDNCDGRVNDGTAVDAHPFYADTDTDGYGALGTTQSACVAPTGFVADATDCDDGRATVHPAAPERCDGLDDDCDGALPSGEVDDDGDGFVECVEDALGWQGAPIDFGDCDDAAPATHPGAMDVAYDGIDQDCDGSDRCDDDGDGFNATECGGEDCDDTLAAVNPDAAERYYDGVDDNCAPEDDDDMDGDGHDSASYGGDDCDDADADTHPGATDAHYDGVVNDCEPSDENDVDGDGFDASITGGSDCDDNNSAVRPDAEELWYDGVDDDCDGNDDDKDRDGYPKRIDCDDADPEAYPSAPGYGPDCSVDDGVDVDTGGLSGDGGGDGGDGGGDDGKLEGGDTGCATAPVPRGIAGLLGALGLLLGLRRRR